MIQVRNLSKRYGNNPPVFQKVNLNVNKGDSVAIIGGSGCGKSTFLRCINGLIIPEEGEILFDGVNILDKNTNIDAVRRRMGMVYQQFNLFSHLNVLENVILAPMKVDGRSKEEAIEEAKKLLELVGMDKRLYHMPGELSGGQKQRAAIARTLAMHPEVILFDEPTSALDPTMVDEVESVIKNLVESGMTSLIVTHEMRFARNVATKVVFLAEQGIYEQGTTEQIFDHPERELTRRFIYRSRMFEKNLTPENYDLYSLASELRAFVSKYETNHRQATLFSALCDELLFPMLTQSGVSRISVQLVCSETGTNHLLMVGFFGVDSDPLNTPFLDNLNRILLRQYSDSVRSEKKDSGEWEVIIEM